MRLVIFGATGGTGGLLVRRALEDDHDVTAVVRDPTRLQAVSKRLRVVRAGLEDAAELAEAVRDADAVLSALGSRAGRGPTTVCSAGTGAIVRAMRSAGVARLVVVGAVPVAPLDRHDTVPYRLLVRPLLRAVLRRAYEDMERMESDLRTSGIDWTVVRPPQLTDGPPTGRYRTAVGHSLRRGYRISRADLAEEMLRVVADPATVRATVAIGN